MVSFSNEMEMCSFAVEMQRNGEQTLDITCFIRSSMKAFLCSVTLSDGPHADPSMVRPAGPNQMVNRLQNPAGMFNTSK